MSEKAILISDSRGACKRLLETLEQNGMLSKYRVIYVNAPEGKDLTVKLGVNAIPARASEFLTETVPKLSRSRDSYHVHWNVRSTKYGSLRDSCMHKVPRAPAQQWWVGIE